MYVSYMIIRNCRGKVTKTSLFRLILTSDIKVGSDYFTPVVPGHMIIRIAGEKVTKSVRNIYYITDKKKTPESQLPGHLTNHYTKNMKNY